MSKIVVPPLIQALGLACVPVHDMPPGEPAVARRPVAAAVISLQLRDDGHREIVAARMSDAWATEFPITWLVNKALVDGAPVIVTPEDRAVLAVEAAGRRYFAEARLAAMCAGERTVDPTMVSGTRVTNEAALCRRLLIQYPQINDVDVERVWRSTPDGAEEVALGIAAARLIMWANMQAFAVGEPDALFETVVPLKDWMEGQEKTAPSLYRAVRSRPVARATSFVETFRQYRAARDAGDETATWITFEDGLFHT